MKRRDFLKTGIALAAGTEFASRKAHALVSAHNWGKYDFGSGPPVADRLNQGPFPQYPPDAVIPTDEVVMTTTPSEDVVPNFGKGLITYITADMGTDEIKADNIPQAIEDLDVVIKQHPDDPEAYIGRAWDYWHAGRSEAALADYETVMRLDPHSSAAYADRGLLQLQNQRFQLAISDFDAALNIKPDADVYGRRSAARRRLNDLAGAFADADKAVALDPKNAIVLVYRALVEMDMKRASDARADFSRAIALDPKNKITYYDRGWLLYLTADYADAISDFNAAIAIDPRYTDALDSRGCAYLALRNFDDAIDDYSAAITANSKLATSYFGRSIAYALKGDLDPAKQDLAIARSLDAAVDQKMAQRSLLLPASLASAAPPSP